MIKVYNTFRNFIYDKPVKVYFSESEYNNDKEIKNDNNLLKLILTINSKGQILSNEKYIPLIDKEKFIKFYESGFRTSGITDMMVAIYDSPANLYKKRAFRVYKSSDCEKKFENDRRTIFRDRKDLIKVVYYFHKKTKEIFEKRYEIPDHLLVEYLPHEVKAGRITLSQASAIKRRKGKVKSFRYNCNNKYIDEINNFNNENSRTNLASNSVSFSNSTNRKSYYFHKDSQGSVRAVTDENGDLIERVEYGIYGNPTFWDYTQDPNNPIKRNRSVIGNDILFQGRRYDYETGLYYFRARYYDPIMGRFLSVDPMGYKDSMNLYQAFNMNPVNFTDPFGFEPVKKYAGIVADIINAMNNSKNKIGLQKGKQAIKALLYLGEFKVSMKKIIPKPIPTGMQYFNMKKGRYIYTKKSGWIDMSHFLFYAGRAYAYKIHKENSKELLQSSFFPFMAASVQHQIAKDSNISPSGEAMQDGFIQEKVDKVFAPWSAYSYEDLPSDKLGIIFALKYFNPKSNLTLGEQVANFLNNVLTATNPTTAPNWNTMPKNHSKNPPSRTNKTTTPIYTSEDVKKFIQFIKWIDSLLK